MDTQKLLNQGTLARMGDEIARGAEIKRRREELGIANLRQFHLATGRDRDTLARVEAGTASETTMDWVEQWLDRREAGGRVEPAAPGPVRVTLHDVYGVGEVIFDGAASPDEMAAYVRALMNELRRGSSAEGPDAD